MMNQVMGQNRLLVQVVASAAALLALLYSAYIAIRYSGQHLLIPAFSFRETQTALTSFWACKDGFKLAYETPVAGYPWSIPFEFPIYQWIVALISCTTGVGLERVGRLVDYAFLLACALPAMGISKSLFGKFWAIYFFTFCAIFFTAPLHVFFGRAFLMETAALFFTLYFVRYMIILLQGSRSLCVATAAGIFLTLAILQKSTTVLPLIPIFGCCLLAVGFREIITDPLKSGVLWAAIVALIIPFLMGFVWNNYCDVVKERNDFGRQLTTNAMMPWTMGGDRFDWKLWLWVIWIRNIVTNLGGWLGIGIVITGLAVLDGKHKLALLVGAVLFLLYFMIFTNLHYVHEYYQISNEVYAIFAVAVALAGMMTARQTILSALGTLALLVLVGVNIHTFLTGVNFESMRAAHGPDDPVLASAHFIRDNTDKSAPIVVYGDDWSSEFPFFSERKAFVAMTGFKDFEDLIAHPARYFAGQEPSAILICRDARTQEFETKVQNAFHSTSVKHLELCDIFLK